MTTPAMTAQEALATLEASTSKYGTHDPIGDGQALAVLAAVLSDAERRATEAVRISDEISSEKDDLEQHADDLQSRLSAVEARCGLMREALEPFATAADDLAENHRDRSEIWDSPAAMGISAGDLRRARSILTYPGGKSDQGEKPADIDAVIGNAFAAATIVEPLSRSGDSAFVEARKLLKPLADVAAMGLKDDWTVKLYVEGKGGGGAGIYVYSKDELEAVQRLAEHHEVQQHGERK